MATAAKKTVKAKKAKGGIATGVRVILATLLIIYLSYWVYRKFGVGDWLTDIGLIFAGIFFIILAAFGVVALFMFIRGKFKKT